MSKAIFSRKKNQIWGNFKIFETKKMKRISSNRGRSPNWHHELKNVAGNLNLINLKIN